MSSRTVIVDYGVGNLHSVARAVAASGGDPFLTSSACDIDSAQRIILPGVGAFGTCVEALSSKGLKQATIRAMEDGRPVLGICVGMQMLMDKGEEFGLHDGLGRVAGRVAAISRQSPSGTPHKIPHIGWAPLTPAFLDWDGTIFDDIEIGSACYFVHSFAAQTDRADVQLATCNYNGLDICAAVKVGNTYGVQFHPEKSGPVGLKIIGNFLRLPT